MRSLISESRRAGMLSSEDADQLTDIPNIKQAGTRKGNWLTREQAKELLAVPDRTKLKGQTRLCDPVSSRRLCPPQDGTG